MNDMNDMNDVDGITLIRWDEPAGEWALQTLQQIANEHHATIQQCTALYSGVARPAWIALTADNHIIASVIDTASPIAHD